MNGADILILALLVPVLGWALYRTVRGFREGNPCGGSCEGCGGCGKRGDQRRKERER